MGWSTNLKREIGGFSGPHTLEDSGEEKTRGEGESRRERPGWIKGHSASQDFARGSSKPFYSGAGREAWKSAELWGRFPGS